MNSRYSVQEIAYPGVLVFERNYPTFAEALERYRQRNEPLVIITNLDRCDYDFDGLTEDEWEQL